MLNLYLQKEFLGTLIISKTNNMKAVNSYTYKLSHISAVVNWLWLPRWSAFRAAVGVSFSCLPRGFQSERQNTSSTHWLKERREAEIASKREKNRLLSWYLEQPLILTLTSSSVSQTEGNVSGKSICVKVLLTEMSSLGSSSSSSFCGQKAKGTITRLKHVSQGTCTHTRTPRKMAMLDSFFLEAAVLLL